MNTFLAPFCFHVAKTANISQINQQCYSKCPKCLPSAFTQAHRRFLKLADCVLHSKSSQVLTSVSGCPLAADSGDRSSAASTPKHDSQADLCPGYLAARSLCQWSLDSELHASHCWVTFAECASTPSYRKINCWPSRIYLLYKTEWRNCNVVVKLVLGKLVLGCF